MKSHRIVAGILCIAAVASCDKNAVQQLPFEPVSGAQIKFFNFGLNAPGVNWVVRDFEEKVEDMLSRYLDGTSLADLAQRKVNLDESLSYMAGI